MKKLRHGHLVYTLRCVQIHRTLKSGKATVDEEYYQQRDSGNWLLEYHVTDTDSETWALAEFDKVYSHRQ